MTSNIPSGDKPVFANTTLDTGRDSNAPKHSGDKKSLQQDVAGSSRPKAPNQSQSWVLQGFTILKRKDPFGFKGLTSKLKTHGESSGERSKTSSPPEDRSFDAQERPRSTQTSNLPPLPQDLSGARRRCSLERERQRMIRLLEEQHARAIENNIDMSHATWKHPKRVTEEFVPSYRGVRHENTPSNTESGSQDSNQPNGDPSHELGTRKPRELLEEQREYLRNVQQRALEGCPPEWYNEKKAGDKPRKVSPIPFDVILKTIEDLDGVTFSDDVKKKVLKQQATKTKK